MPTSGGKTLLAEFKILQALNQFAADKGWVAYVAPTRALVSQITRRLRKDFGPKDHLTNFYSFLIISFLLEWSYMFELVICAMPTSY